MTPCRLAPEGWFCSREDGHDGPCAAWRFERRRDKWLRAFMYAILLTAAWWVAEVVLGPTGYGLVTVFVVAVFGYVAGWAGARDL